jgi:carbon monoxide dehydrogenase subunit G
MTKVQSVVEIEAPIDTVWDVLTDTAYIVKLFRDAVGVKVDPPGRSFVGQKYHIIGKVGRRRIEIFLQVAELVPKSKVVTVHTPGGLFKSFEQETLLHPGPGATVAKTTFEYELSLGYLGRVLNQILVERLVRDNLRSYSNTLKELSELLPLPGAEEGNA